MISVPAIANHAVLDEVEPSFFEPLASTYMESVFRVYLYPSLRAFFAKQPNVLCELAEGNPFIMLRLVPLSSQYLSRWYYCGRTLGCFVPQKNCGTRNYEFIDRL